MIVLPGRANQKLDGRGQGLGMDQLDQQPLGGVEIGDVAGQECRGFGHRLDHQGHLGDDPKRTQGAGQEPADVVSGGVLDYPAAPGERRAATVDRLNSDHVVAEGAPKVLSGSAGVGCHHTAHGGPLGSGDIDREPLSLGGQSAGELGHRHARLDGDREIAGGVVDHLVQPRKR